MEFSWCRSLVSTAPAVTAMLAAGISTTAPVERPSGTPSRLATTVLVGAGIHAIANIRVRWVATCCCIQRRVPDKHHPALAGGVLLLERREARMRRE